MNFSTSVFFGIWRETNHSLDFYKDADNIEEAKEGIVTKAEYQKTEKQ